MRNFFTLRRRPTAPGSVRALAMLDVLIGMAIFAVIAAIAIVVVGNFRERAFLTGAISDARSIGMALEADATKTGRFPTILTAPGTGDREITANVAAKPRTGTPPATVAAETTGPRKIGILTRGNRVPNYVYLPATAEDGSGFKLCVEHVENGEVSDPNAAGDAHAIYDSRAGGVSISGDGGCTGAWKDLDNPTDPGGDPDPDPTPQECGPDEELVLIPGEPAGSGQENATAVAVNKTLLPWEAGISEADWRAQGYDWWHNGDPERYSVNAQNQVLLDGEYLEYTYINVHWHNTPSPNTTAEGIRVNFELPWEAGYTEADWRRTRQDWWHNGNPDAYVVNPDTGIVSMRFDGGDVMWTRTWEATPDTYECQSTEEPPPSQQ